MAKTHIPLEDLFLGEEAAQVVEALAESIARAGSDECRLIIEGRAEPDETRRSRQEFTVELDPGSDPPPHAESVLAELQRNYEEALSPGFTGTVRLNFKGKGQGTTYRSIQRKAFIEGLEEEEEPDEDEYLMEDDELPPSRYGGTSPPPRGRLFRPHSSRSPRLDLSREDEDEGYFDEASPPGTISPGRVRGLSPGQGEYIFLPHFEAVINVGERRNDRVMKALMEQQHLQVEVTKGLLENQRELNEQLLGMIGTKSLRSNQQPAEKPQDGKMASWLGSMLVNGVMKQMGAAGDGAKAKGGGSGQRQATAPRGAVQSSPREDYDPYDNPTFTVPSAHSSEFAGEEKWNDEEEEFRAPMRRPEGSPSSSGSDGPMSGNEIMDAIRDLRETDPDAFKETIQERGEELLPAVMEAMSE